MNHVEELIAAGRWMAARGLLPATSGNLSARVSKAHVAVTKSGRDKADLRPEDFLVADLREPPPPNASAETPLHLRLYRDYPDVGAVLHGHSLASTLASTLIGQRHQSSGVLRLRGYELQKAFAGIHTHEITVAVPVFDNDQDMVALADRVAARLAEQPSDGETAAPCYLLAGHGFYCWGQTVTDARRHLEALEFLLHCELAKARMAP